MILKSIRIGLYTVYLRTIRRRFWHAAACVTPAGTEINPEAQRFMPSLLVIVRQVTSCYRRSLCQLAKQKFNTHKHGKTNDTRLFASGIKHINIAVSQPWHAIISSCLSLVIGRESNYAIVICKLNSVCKQHIDAAQVFLFFNCGDELDFFN